MPISEILKNSVLYKEFDKDDDIKKVVDKKYLLENININNINDLEKVLEAFRFWGVDIIPWSIYDFMVANPDLDYSDLISNLWDYKYIQELTILANYKNKKIITKICKFGLLDMLKWFHNKYIINQCDTISEDHRKTIWTKDIMMIIAFKGHLECLKFLHENGCPWNERTCDQAAKKNRLDCLKYLHKNGCPIGVNTINQAIKVKDLRILKYLCEINCPANCNNFNHAIKLNNIDALIYLHNKFGKQNHIYFNDIIVKKKFLFLNFLLSNGYSYTIYDIILTIKENYFEGLKIFIENDNRFIMDEEIIGNAILKNNYEMINYLKKKGYYWDKLLYSYAFSKKSLDLVKYLYNNNCPLDKDLFIYIISHHNLEKIYDILDYLIKVNCPYHEDACNEAIRRCNIDLLKYFHKNKFYWDENTYDVVIQYTSKLKYIDYLHKNGCPWNIKSSLKAIKTYDLKLIKYLFENNIELDKEIYNFYLKKKNQSTYRLSVGKIDEVFDYLHDKLFFKIIDSNIKIL